MEGANPSVGLSERLEQLLSSIPDRAYSGKLRSVYLAAAKAIHRLSDIDLLRYETTSAEGAPDLSLWEEMAPVIRDTVMDVNALLMVIREHFPVHPPGGLGDTLLNALEGGKPNRRTSQAEASLWSASESLAEEITHLGERMRSPSVVSDRWNLLADMQSFRSRFREQIGNLVHTTASAFGEVHRREVVPFYKEELDAAVKVRSTVSDLNRVISARLTRVREAEPEDVQWNAHQLEKELDVFGCTPAYRALRAQDKRQVIELRHALGTIAGNSALPRRALIALVEPFAAFVQSLGQVNNRELLVSHDREVTAACAVKLERAQGMLATDRAGAAKGVAEALAIAQALYGRDPALDAFLRRVKMGSFEPQLEETLQRFMGLLGELALY